MENFTLAIAFRYVSLAILLLCIHPQAWAQKPCLNFDGTDDYVEVPNTALNNIGLNDFTFEAWIKGDVAVQPAHPVIFSNRSSVGNGIMFFFHNLWGGSAYKMLAVQLNQNANYSLIDNGAFNDNLLDGRCHHVAITRDNDSLYFYADGSLIGVRKVFNTIPTLSSTANLWIGQDGPTNNSFEGVISEVRIWDVARSASEIFNNMNVSLPGSTPGLAAYWELNDGSGQVILDKTTNYNGQLGGSMMGDPNDPQWFSDCCAIPTAIFDDPSNGIGLQLSPNPNNGRFAIDLTDISDGNPEIEVRIFDLNGKTIAEKTTISNKTFVDISQHPAGMYLIQVFTDQIIATQKFWKY